MNRTVQPVAAARRVVDYEFDEFEVEDREPAIDLHQLMAAVRRNRWLILAVVLAAVLLGLVATMLMTPRYTATASIQIDQESARILDSQDVQPTSAIQDADRFLQTQVDVLKSRAMALRVVDSLNLHENAEFITQMGERLEPTDEEGATNLDHSIAGLIEDNLTVELPRESRVVSISFNSPDPDLAAKIANAYVTNYISYNLERKYNSSSYARDFLQKQLALARTRLEDSERAVTDYARAAGLIRTTDPSSTGANGQSSPTSVTTASLIQQNQAVNAATTARIAAEQRWRAVANQSPLNISDVQSNQAVQQLLTTRAQKQAELEQELAVHQSAHPSVMALRAQVAEINAQLNTIASGIKNSIKTAYDVARNQERALLGQVSQLTGETLAEQDRGVRFGILQREADTNRTLYDGLLQRFRDVSAQSGITDNNISSVDEAVPPAEPSSPNLMLNLLMALLAGIGLAAALVFLREQLDDTVRLPEDVEHKLGLQLLGVVPHIEDSDVPDLLNNPKSNLSEAYSALRTSILHSSTSGLPHTILVTSTQASEGKSTTSYALAKALAGLGRNILLIDVDLRRPSLHRILGEKSSKEGFSSLLTRQSDVEAVLETRAEGSGQLSHIIAGPIPPNPTDLLGSERMAELVATLAEQYDAVIMDGPPVLGLADSPIISAQAEATIFVIEAGRSHRGASKLALRRLRTANARILGAVMTKFKPDKSTDYGYYGYDYYSYGSKDQSASDQTA
ncbi:polysaccharide biosynthesis tyrosine autokinase [Roseibium sp.]|uniref:GumC family protein n=1 Tax=Roseibium sp. TaxID=1936156 RepID=UPI00329A1C45